MASQPANTTNPPKQKPHTAAGNTTATAAAKNLLEGIDVLRGMNIDNAHKVSINVPTGLIKAASRLRD